MKVYAAPENIKLTPDYRNYDRNAEQQKEEAYMEAIKADLIKDGYTGPLTGEIASFPVADGSALYMYADAGRRSCLIHLDIGDAYQFPFIERLTKADLLQSINRNKNLKAMFASR